MLAGLRFWAFGNRRLHRLGSIEDIAVSCRFEDVGIGICLSPRSVEEASRFHELTLLHIEYLNSLLKRNKLELLVLICALDM